MDPYAALYAIVTAGPTVGVAFAGEYRAEFNAWIARGGFAPRVEIHPARDAWMQGDRFGAVVKVGTKNLHVKMDRSGRTLVLPISGGLYAIDGAPLPS